MVDSSPAKEQGAAPSIPARIIEATPFPESPFSSIGLAEKLAKALQVKGALGKLFNRLGLPDLDTTIAEANAGITARLAALNKDEMIAINQKDPVSKWIAEHLWGVTDVTDAGQRQKAYTDAIDFSTQGISKLFGVPIPAGLKGVANLLVGGSMLVSTEVQHAIRAKIHPLKPVAPQPVSIA